MEEETVKNAFAFLIKAGYEYEWTYDKGSDSSCVYIHRFKRGENFVDFRKTSGGKEESIVVKTDGELFFPNFKTAFKKEYRAFQRKRFFKKVTEEEIWAQRAKFFMLALEKGFLKIKGLENR